MEAASQAREELEKYAEILRVMIRHENDVTNHRTTWLLVAQGILFAAAASFVRIHWFPTIVVCIVGILTAVSIGHVLKNSYDSRQYLKRTWRERIMEHGYEWEDFPPLDGGFPGLKTINWLFPWTFIPQVVVAAWLLLIVYFILV